MWWGRYPGHGPFSYLPPWERPGWVYGRGVCWWYPYGYPAYRTKEEEIAALKDEQRDLQARLREIEERLKELEG
ncbi:MAG: hypothetical protein EF806_05070 [Candidatus Methanoliparum thermophilum]|uniref:DUF5320 domain-containing protein n=1 Tax=Methanoliparum thermophilum TaxID=2491083 RepID=A0A520KRB5_METT2|nr:DUF5320 domain-containing protein [Candidatus Methanoliparum sp. LAM-1]RZN64186.1 MAG: hypothetical protein EF806_05070 [Candidatus Methanoliparum thermophilum]BDC36636.1 hypothetical protein MTLP_13180 [Candidatus Methanoliparum sp. LAM-1]